MGQPETEVHLTIASRFENIELVKVVLDDSLKGLGADEDTRHWMELAVREGVANAIKHGNRQDAKKKVDVTVAVDDDELIVEVADEGTGFDPNAVKDPLAAENRFSRDGRGIFYMRKFMDSVDYRFRPEGGTVLTLRKRLQRASGGDQNQAEEETL